MFTGDELTAALVGCGVSHVVWLPDSTLGTWESSLTSSRQLNLVRVCREAEAWGVAAGLHLGGQHPVVMIQCTGLFDSGDALRNFIYDFELPLFAIIGYRNYLLADSRDSARTFTEPQVCLWNLDYRLIERRDQLPVLTSHYVACRTANRPGAVLIGEGRL
jgi:sulfopyruvate decarboxylase TPP-binding subunit